MEQLCEKEFCELLAKVMGKKANDEEEERFWGDYLNEGCSTQLVNDDNFMYYKIAADRDLAFAHSALADFFLDENTKNYDLSQGTAYLRKALEAGYSYWGRLGDFYRRGVGVEKDFEKAYECYKKDQESESDYQEYKGALMLDTTAVYSFMEQAPDAAQWFEFVASKEGLTPAIIDTMCALVYPWESDRWWDWVDRGCQLGLAFALSSKAKKLLQDNKIDEARQLLLKIIDSRENSDAMADAAKKLCELPLNYDGQVNLVEHLAEAGYQFTEVYELLKSREDFDEDEFCMIWDVLHDDEKNNADDVDDVDDADDADENMLYNQFRNR